MNPGEAAVDLPWILPCAGSLVGLTRPDAASVWSQARFDPGLVLLLARASPSESLSSQLHEKAVLEMALAWLAQGRRHFVNWSTPGADHVQRTCAQQALLAQTIAVRAGC